MLSLSLALEPIIVMKITMRNSMRKELENVIITDKQAELIKDWIEANSKVPGWLDGYPLGQSYIDTRANGGRGIAERRRYVKLDHSVANSVPELRGYSVHDIKEYIAGRTPEVTEEETTGLHL